MHFDEDEEEFIDDMDMDEDELPPFLLSERSRKRNSDTIREFLGKGEQVHSPIVKPRYYCDLLAWALQHHIESQGWKIIKTLGYYGAIPRYMDVNHDYNEYKNALCFGSLLLQREDKRIVASIRAIPEHSALLVIVSRHKKETQQFAEGIEKFATGDRLYKGKNLGLGNRICFLNLPPKSWQDLALDSILKDEIETNTIGFLKRTEELSRYRIPPRRGIMLVGEPGTGKTLISKILMNNSPGITCIAADESGLTSSRYINELYELARDLSPTIVFIEDIDLVGEDRRESHYSRGQALTALLSRLDGIEECENVVTVATTNFLENIDKALTERPSRFDRIIQLPSPSLMQRKELIRYLSQTIPLDEAIQEYLARRTENYTPAQVQEVVYSLVIEHEHNHDSDETSRCKFSIDDVDSVLARINRKNRPMGFRKQASNGNGSKHEAMSYSEVKHFNQ